MIDNLIDYFDNEQEYYLDNISYERINSSIDESQPQMYCMDTINADLAEDGVQLTLTRRVYFNPEELYTLSVSYGAILKFNKNRKDEFNWEEINLSEEFRENGQFVWGNLMNRITLLIAEITSSFGQPPVILYPGLAPKEN